MSTEFWKGQHAPFLPMNSVSEDGRPVTHRGMSLQQQFAMTAMQTILGRADCKVMGTANLKTIAFRCFELADVMLKESMGREKLDYEHWYNEQVKAHKDAMASMEKLRVTIPEPEPDPAPVPPEEAVKDNLPVDKPEPDMTPNNV